MGSKRRNWLRHGVPTFVDQTEELFFITVCCQERGASILTEPKTGELILESVQNRIERQLWSPFVFMIMPDHIHTIVRFRPRSRGMVSEMKTWKSWMAKTASIRWQDGFFDHRIRSRESLSEKIEYILQNPVRAGLVECAEDWRWKLVEE